MANEPTTNTASSTTDTIRAHLALWVSLLSLVVLGAISITVILSSELSKRDQVSQFVLTGLLPLVGSWVGTILAYFFSSESLRAATNSVSTLTQQLTATDRLRSTPVKEKMIKRAEFKEAKTPPLNTINIQEVLGRLTTAGVNRLIVLEANGHPVLVVHRSILDRFISTKSVPPVAPAGGGAAPAAPVLADQTLQHVKEDAVFGPKLVSTFKTVRIDATLAEAKTLMDGTQDCQDILVTETGTANEPVLGWITNITVEENSRA